MSVPSLGRVFLSKASPRGLISNRLNLWSSSKASKNALNRFLYSIDCSFATPLVHCPHHYPRSICGSWANYTHIITIIHFLSRIPYNGSTVLTFYEHVRHMPRRRVHCYRILFVYGVWGEGKVSREIGWRGGEWRNNMNRNLVSTESPACLLTRRVTFKPVSLFPGLLTHLSSWYTFLLIRYDVSSARTHPPPKTMQEYLETLLSSKLTKKKLLKYDFFCMVS